MGDGLVWTAQVGEHEAQIAFVIGVAGSEDQGAFDVAARLLEVTARCQQQSQISLGAGQIGAKIKCLCDIGICLG